MDMIPSLQYDKNMKALDSELEKVNKKILLLKGEIRKDITLIDTFQRKKVARMEENKLLVAEREPIEDKIVIQKIPPEIWTLIFNNLKESPSSLVACYRTTTLWRKVLRRDRTSFLFTEVFPLLAGYLEDEDIYNCRLVSNSWKTGIEKYLLAREAKIYSFIPLQTPEFREPLEFKRNLSQFMRHAASDNSYRYQINRNPLVTRCITFNDNYQNDSFAFWKYIVETFLPKFGSYIECCEFVFVNQNLSIRLILFAALKDLPNLVTLSVKTPSLKFINGNIGTMQESSGQNLHGRPMQIPDNAGALTCQKLEYLNCLRTSDLMPDIIGEMLAAAPNVTKMEIIHLTKLLYSESCDIPFKMASVRELYMNSFIGFFKFGQCPIRVLCIESAISIPELVKMTSSFENTLRVLDFRLKSVEHNSILSHDTTLRSQFGLLEVLRIQILSMGYTSMDFILPMVSLKELNLAVKNRKLPASPCYAHRDNQIVNIDEYYLENMEESNIWRLLPNLESITVKLKYKKEWVRGYSRPSK